MFGVSITLSEPVILFKVYIETGKVPFLSYARIRYDKFNGEVPADMDLLQMLPGVGRKTANVITSVIYDMPNIAVDTHVFRVAARIGLSTGTKTPLQTELQLIRYIPEENRARAHHWLILHGRYICKARKPECFRCGVTRYCKYYSSHKKA